MKPTLYTFPGSVWAAAAELAIIELGYTKETIQYKIVNLVEGQNFEPSFININPKATLPTLVDGTESYTTTIEVIRYLLNNAPSKAGNSSGTHLVTLIHEDKLDPNFAKLSVRNEEEIKAKGASHTGKFLRSRQAKLELLTPAHPEFKDFYDAKTTSNGFLVSVFDGKAPDAAKAALFAKSSQLWDNITNFITTTLPEYLPESGFIGGERPGEDDFHLGAWIARIGAILGAPNESEGAEVFAGALGQNVPVKVQTYWSTWVGRESWSKIYEHGLH